MIALALAGGAVGGTVGNSLGGRVIAELGNTGTASIAGTVVFLIGIVAGFGIGVGVWAALAGRRGVPPDRPE